LSEVLLFEDGARLFEGGNNIHGISDLGTPCPESGPLFDENDAFIPSICHPYKQIRSLLLSSLSLLGVLLNSYKSMYLYLSEWKSAGNFSDGSIQKSSPYQREPTM
jgi:hypothetical protein